MIVYCLFLLHFNSLKIKCHHAAPTRVYLSKPEEVLHEGNREGILNLHDWNLILGRHQNVVVSVEYGGEVETSGRRQNTSVRKTAQQFLTQTDFAYRLFLHFLNSLRKSVLQGPVCK